MEARQRNLAVVTIGLLLAIMPAHAEQTSGQPEGSSGGSHGNEGANGTANQDTAGTTQSGCEVVSWWGLGRPTHIVVDPQDCYLPEPIRELVLNRL